VNVYDPTENPLGTRSLEELSLVLGQRIQLAQMCTNIAIRQQVIAAPSSDAGLVAKIDVFQAQLINNAKTFYRTTDSSLLKLLSQITNISSLLDALIKVEQTVLVDAVDHAESRTEISDAFTVVSDEIGKLSIKFHGLQSELAASKTDRGGFSAALSAAIDSLIVNLGAAAVSSGNDIDRLQKAIQDNIQAIVDGGNELAGGITQLGTGIVTTIFNSIDPAAGAAEGAGDKLVTAATASDDVDASSNEGEGDDSSNEGEGADEDDDDGSTPEKPELPDTGFAAESIVVVADGTAKMTQAQTDIANDTQRLAVAYDKLATAESWIAVAKAIQANNELYVGAITALSDSVDSLKSDFQKIAGNLLNLSGEIDGGIDNARARQLKRVMSAAQLMWSQLDDKVKGIKNSLAGVA